MNFPRIESALRVCEAHIGHVEEEDPALSAELESHLVSGLTLLIVSEFEVFIEGAFSRRGETSGDVHLANFVRSQLAKRFRSPDLGKINDILKSFGQDYKDAFFSQIENTPQHAAWDNIMRARHEIVHAQGTPNLTIRELSESFDKTKEVIKKLLATLGLEEGPEKNRSSLDATKQGSIDS